MENKDLITKAIQYIQHNAKEKLSLQSIAENAGFSLTYFDALFKKHTGYRPVEYSRIYKLTRSAITLRMTEKTVLDVALEFGYDSPESYTRAFRRFYGMTPSEYRKKYYGIPLGVKDYSSKVSINRFKNNFSGLKRVDLEIALDYLFLHNYLKYSEDIIGLTITETEVFTIGTEAELEHFIYISDYNSPIASVGIVCENENTAIEYLDLLLRSEVNSFTIRISPNEKWEKLKTVAEKYGIKYNISFDMLYCEDECYNLDLPSLFVRELFAEDMPSVRFFKEKGGCNDCHVRGLQVHYDNKGNVGERAFGVFHENELICLATPVLDIVRDLRKYDIGAVFTLEHNMAQKAKELIWQFIIKTCVDERAFLGNASADDTGNCSVKESENVGLTKVAKVIRLFK